MMKLKLFILTGIVTLMASCSHMKSGHYVQVRPSDTVETLSKEFNVPKEKIIQSNAGRKISSGEWVFIPLKRGVAGEISTYPQDPDRLLQSGEFAWPVPSSNRVSSNFGKRWGRAHQGMDIAAKVGSHIVAASDGVIVYQGDEISGYGLITVIAHRNGYFTVYAHANKNFTKKGQRVYRGQVIAVVGMTGRTYGPHLHFEIRKNGKSIDPSQFLASNLNTNNN